MTPQLNSLVLSKLALWVLAVAVATLLLRRKKVNKRLRTTWLAAGALLFGFVYSYLIPGPLNPNPMCSLRNAASSLLGAAAQVPLTQSLLMLGLVLALVIVSNKSICGWGCQLGLLQDLLHRAPTPKVSFSFRVTNTVRVAFAVLWVGALALLGLDLLGVLNPFTVFKLSLFSVAGFTGLLVLGASLFTYRPWCRFVCPFGLLGWAAEQFSFMGPRIDREMCKNCRMCVRACPTDAMEAYYGGERLHPDCFACGACIEACPFDALEWRR